MKNDKKTLWGRGQIAPKERRNDATRPTPKSQKSAYSAETTSIFKSSKLWIAVLVPWALDFLSPHLFLTTVIGAALWYLLIAGTILKHSAKDQNLQNFAKKSVVILWGLWILSFIGNIILSNPEALSELEHLETAAWFTPTINPWLIRIHATLFAGAAGLVFLGAVASMAWIIQMKRVRAKSWERRRRGSFSLPSLESLAQVSRSSTRWAFWGWGLGLSLAIASMILTQAFQWSVFKDSQIVFSVFLWTLLLFSLFLQSRDALDENRKQWIVIFTNSCFWCLLLLHALSTHYMSFHEPIRWWTR
ncbi:hypothetical protein GW916_09580 [bacterium]|nr:hypothetical protein [bacterium]